jgi:DNA polymerase-3 subunit epsilon
MNNQPALPRAIVAIDVETVNPQGAICEFAAVAIDCRTGDLLFTVASLVDPGDVDWSPMTTSFHGITPEQVDGQPSISVVWNQFTSKLENATDARLYAHNAAMDRSWLTKSLGQAPAHHIECTIELAKRSLPLPTYKLGAVCAVLGIPFEETHRATADATATAHVARHLLLGLRSGASRGKTQGPAAKTTTATRSTAGRQWTSNEARGKNSEIIANTRRIGRKLVGLTVCITGQFACGWSRKEAKAKIVAHGGTPIDDVTGSCNLLVIAGKAGALQPSDFATEKAKKAKNRGIRVIGEQELLELIDE